MSDDEEPTFSVTVYARPPKPKRSMTSIVLEATWESLPIVQAYHVVRHPLDTLDSLGYHFYAAAVCGMGIADCSSTQAKIDAAIGVISLVPIPAGKGAGLEAVSVERGLLRGLERVSSEVEGCPSCPRTKSGGARVGRERALREEAEARAAQKAAREDAEALAKPGGLGKTEAQLQMMAARVKAMPIDAGAVARARKHLAGAATLEIYQKALKRLDAHVRGEGPLVDADAKLVRHEVLEDELMNRTMAEKEKVVPGGMDYQTAHETALKKLGDKNPDLFLQSDLDACEVPKIWSPDGDRIVTREYYMRMVEDADWPPPKE